MSEKMIRLLIIDDEAEVRKFLRLSLDSKYQLEEAASGREGIQKAAEFHPEVIVLDLGLPDMDGFEVLRNLRGWTKVPILVLTVRDSEQEKVKLLDAGADDYLTKPFSVPELMARLKVALRHSQTIETETPVFKSGILEVDFVNRVVKVKGEQVKLTVTEFNLLRMLASARGRIVTQQNLLNEIWGPNASENVQYLRVYIGALRKKLENDPAAPTLILTEPGVGYRLKLDAGQ